MKRKRSWIRLCILLLLLTPSLLLRDFIFTFAESSGIGVEIIDSNIKFQTTETAASTSIRYKTIGWTITKEPAYGTPTQIDHAKMVGEQVEQVGQDPPDPQPGEIVKTRFEIKKNWVEAAMREANMLDTVDGQTVYLHGIFQIIGGPNDGQTFDSLEGIRNAEYWRDPSVFDQYFDIAVPFDSANYEAKAVVKLLNADYTLFKQLPPITIATEVAGIPFSHTFDEKITEPDTGKTYELYKSYFFRNLKPHEELFAKFKGDAPFYTRHASISVGGTTVVGVYVEVSDSPPPPPNDPEKPNLVAVDLVAESAVRVGMPTGFSAFIKNTGSDVSESFLFRIEHEGQEIFSRTVSSMNKDEQLSFYFDHTFSSAGTKVLTLKVDALDQIEETSEHDNERTRSFEAQENVLDGDFRIEPGSSIDFRDPFELVPEDIDTGSCSYEYHRFRFEDPYGKIGYSSKVYGKDQPLEITYPYPRGIEVGENQISIKIVSNCGETDYIKTKPLEIVPDPNNSPPVFEAGFFEYGNLYGFNPIYEVVEGEYVNLRIIEKPFLDPPEPYDPEGDEPIQYHWDFAGSSSAWIRSLPSTYGLYPEDMAFNEIVASEIGYHRMEVTACDTQGACSTATAILNVVPPNPVPIIQGPDEVVEGRPLPEPFDGSDSYSPAGRSIVEYLWSNKRDLYMTPGIEEITLEVIDSLGLKSLPERKAKHILVVKEDLPPVAQLEYIPITLRNTSVGFKDTSYSPDGDQIVERQITYQYDSNNDGSFSGETLLSVNPRSDGTFDLSFAKVGHYRFQVYVKEDWGKSDTKTFDLKVTNEGPEVQFTVKGESPQPTEKEVKVFESEDFLADDWKVVSMEGEEIKHGQFWIEDDALYNPYDKFQSQYVSPTSSNVKVLLSKYRKRSITTLFQKIDHLEGNKFYFWSYYYGDTFFVEIDEEKANVSNPDFLERENYQSCVAIAGRVKRIDEKNDLVWMHIEDDGHDVYRISDLFNGNSTCDDVDEAPVFEKRTDDNHYIPPMFRDIENKYTLYDYSRSSDFKDAAGFEYHEFKVYEKRYVSCWDGPEYIYKQKSPHVGEDQPYEWRVRIDPTSCWNHFSFQGISNDNSKLILTENETKGDPKRNYLLQHHTRVAIVDNDTGTVTKLQTLPGQFLLFHNDTIVIAEEVHNKYYIRYYDIHLNLTYSSPVIKDVSWYTENSYYEDDWDDTYSLDMDMLAIVSADNKIILANFFENVIVLDFEGNIETTIDLRNKDPYSWCSYDEYDDDWDCSYYSLEDIKLIEDGKILVSYYGNGYIYAYIIETDVDENTSNDLFGQWINEKETMQDGEVSYTIAWDHWNNTNIAASGYSFRIQDSSNMYRIEHTREETRLVKFENGIRYVLNAIPYPMDIREEYRFQIKAYSNLIRVYDERGIPILSATDHTFATGMHGPYSNSEFFRIKDIRFTQDKHASDYIKNVAIVGQPVDYEVEYSDLENDPQVKALSVWHIQHINPTKFLNAGDGYSGLSAIHNQTVVSPNPSFDKVGVYEVEYSAVDDPHPDYLYPQNTFKDFRQRSIPYTEQVMVHRIPVARFTLSLNGKGEVVWNDTSYDPDRWLSPTYYSTENTGIDYKATRGIVERKYYYVSPSGKIEYEQLVRPQEAGTYEVFLSVRDEYGAWSPWYSQTITASTVFPDDEPPHAGFTVSDSLSYRGVPLVIDSTAWDAEDGARENLEHAYYIRNVTEGSAETLQSKGRTVWNKTFSSMGVFEIRQLVRDSVGQTDEAIRTVEIVNRKPSAVITTPASSNVSNPTRFNTRKPKLYWNYSDQDGDSQVRYQLQITQASSGSTVLDTGVQTGSHVEWTPAYDLPIDTVLAVRIRVDDGYEWSDWSSNKYLIIDLNDPPVAEVTFPTGSQSSPTIVSTTRPTISWKQTDPDAGTIFTGYALKFTDAYGQRLYETGERSQHTAANTQNWTLDTDLPVGKKMQVQVRVKDEAVWSAWSSPKWLYVNRPPQANFDYSPKPVWEGDTVYLQNLSTDPDGDTMTYQWEILDPYGNRLVHQSKDFVHDFDIVGTYEVTLTVDDGIAFDQMTRLIDVGLLKLVPEVEHTPSWRQYHVSKGHEVTHDPKDFFSGEQFLVYAQVSPAPVRKLQAWIESEDRSGQPLFIETELTPQSAERFQGVLYDAILASTDHGLPEGMEQIHFEVVYQNGVTKQADVSVHIIGLTMETIGVHRVQ